LVVNLYYKKLLTTTQRCSF